MHFKGFDPRSPLHHVIVSQSVPDPANPVSTMSPKTEPDCTATDLPSSNRIVSSVSAPQRTPRGVRIFEPDDVTRVREERTQALVEHAHTKATGKRLEVASPTGFGSSYQSVFRAGSWRSDRRAAEGDERATRPLQASRHDEYRGAIRSRRISVRARWVIAITVKGNGLIVRRFFAPCERCDENVADQKDADRWTTHLKARLKPFAHSTFRTLKLRANANPTNGCIDKIADNSPNAAEGIAET